MAASSDANDSLLAKRLRFLARHREKIKLTSPPAAPQGSGAPNRHGMPKLPLGQHEAPQWPVLDLGVHPDIPPEKWELEITGLVAHPCRLTWEQLLALPQVEQSSDFHCVTTWSTMDLPWKGVLFQDLAALVEPKDEAQFLLCTGTDHDPNSGENYTTNLRLADALADDVLLVHSVHGQPLPREHGGPVRMITPRLYAWKGTKWICRIEFLAEEQLGFWERRGYSNSANPWLEQRYA